MESPVPTVDELLERVAARTPTPGGGTVTAIAGALAIALSRMVAEYSVSPKGSAGSNAYFTTLLPQLRRIDEMLRALSTRDSQAYAGLVEAKKRLKEMDSPQNREALQSAQHDAAMVPLETAALLVRALGLMDEMKSTANRNLLSDLSIAATLSAAAAHGSLRLVKLNLGSLTDAAQRERVATEAKALQHRLGIHAAQIESFIAAALESAR